MKILLSYAYLLLGSFFLFDHSVAFSKELMLTTGTDYPPFTAKEVDGGGISVLVVKRIIQEMGHTMKLRWHPWSRGESCVIKGKCFATFPYIYSEERAKKYLFSEPFMIAPVALFVRKDDKSFKFDRLEDLKGKILCNPRGWSLGKIQPAANKKYIKIHVVNKIDQCYRLVKIKRTDFFFVNEIVGWYKSKQLFGEKGKIVFRSIKNPLLVESDHRFMLSKTLPNGKKWVDKLNKTIRLLKEKKIIDSIANKFR